MCARLFPSLLLQYSPPRETSAKPPRDILPASSKACETPKNQLIHFETVSPAPKHLGSSQSGVNALVRARFRVIQFMSKPGPSTKGFEA